MTTPANSKVATAFAAIAADIAKRKSEARPVVHAEMTPLEDPLWAALIEVGALTAKQAEGAYIEWQSIVEFEDHLAVVYDVPEPMPAEEYNALCVAVFNEVPGAEAKQAAYLAETGTWMCVKADGSTFVC